MEYVQHMRYHDGYDLYEAIAHLRLLSNRVQIKVGNEWLNTDIPVQKITLSKEQR